jgi:calcineurin-like phosphoesterase family protein
MQVFFTGCTHFGHANIIKLANRPFADVEEMNEALVERWNARVRPGDRVYHLGDVAWKTATPWMERLNGQKFVLIGNHDERSELESAAGSIMDIRDYHELKAGGARFVLFHYPIEDWNGRWRGAIHLHCHTHAKEFRNPNLPDAPIELKCNRFNVGVDACGFAPVSVDEVVAAAKGVGG